MHLRKHAGLIIMLGSTYFIFAILLTSVGTVILQVMNSYGVSKVMAGTLEAFKDLPSAVISFFVASGLNRFGYKKAIITGLSIISVVSLIMPLLPYFVMTQVLFALTGIGFALVKISVYSTIGLMAETRRQHAIVMNIVEAMFMLGVVMGYAVFSVFIDRDNPASLEWLNAYWLIGIFSTILTIIWFFVKIDESDIEAHDNSHYMKQFMEMIGFIKLKLVCVFIISIFLYVLIEQTLATWLPTFNNKILNLPADISVQITGIFAVCFVIGRFSASAILIKVRWYYLLNACLICTALIIIGTLPLVATISDPQSLRLFGIPIVAYMLPLTGLFLAPIYPAISSVMLSAMARHQQAQMTGLIIVFSCLGGTTGSFLTGIMFEKIGGDVAFYFSLIPIAVMMIALFFMRKNS